MEISEYIEAMADLAEELAQELPTENHVAALYAITRLFDRAMWNHMMGAIDNERENQHNG